MCNSAASVVLRTWCSIRIYIKNNFRPVIVRETPNLVKQYIAPRVQNILLIIRFGLLNVQYIYNKALVCQDFKRNNHCTDLRYFIITETWIKGDQTTIVPFNFTNPSWPCGWSSCYSWTLHKMFPHLCLYVSHI